MLNTFLHPIPKVSLILQKDGFRIQMSKSALLKSPALLLGRRCEKNDTLDGLFFDASMADCSRVRQKVRQFAVDTHLSVSLGFTC